MIDQLRQTRINARLSQQAVADMLGVSQPEYSKIETGIRKKVSMTEIQMLIDKIYKQREQ